MVVAGTATPNLKTAAFGSRTAATPSNFRSQSNPKRPPLLPSEKDNTGNGGIAGVQRRPKSREISSRYLSTSSSSCTSNSSSSTSLSSSSFFSSSPSGRRWASPVVARSAVSTPVMSSSAVVKRAMSTERRRPATPKGREMSAAAKLLVASSRSLSVSSQGESYAVPRVKVAKPPPVINSPSPSPSTPSMRKGTPERKRSAVATPRLSGGENARPSDQPWPGRVVSMSRSVDLGSEGRKSSNCGSGKVVRTLQESLMSDRNSSRVSSSTSLRRSVSKDDDDESVSVGGCGNVASECMSTSVGMRSLVSDVESVLSEGNSVSQDSNSNSDGVVGRSKAGGRSIVVPPRYREAASSLSRRSSEVKAPLSVPPKLNVPRKFGIDSPGASPRGPLSNRGLSPTVHGTVRPASPSKLGSVRSASPSKLGSVRPASPGNLGSVRPASPGTVVPVRLASPGRIEPVRPASPGGRIVSVRPASSGGRLTSGRPASSGGRLTSGRPASPGKLTSMRPASPGKLTSMRPASPSSPSRRMGRVSSPSRVRSAVGGTLGGPFYGTDVRRVNVGGSQLGDADQLRLLYNRHLQWRFVNARSEALLSIQEVNAERSLYSSWRTISDLRAAVTSKRKELQWLRQKLKLLSILKGQISQLEEWGLMDKDHSSSLSSAIESLKGSTVRLPLVAGARVDIQELNEAICSAADVMHSMAASICSLLQKVEDVNSVMAELVSVIAKEHSLLDECEDNLSMLAAMQVIDCSLRAHILQLKHAPPSLATKV